MTWVLGADLIKAPSMRQWFLKQKLSPLKQGCELAKVPGLILWNIEKRAATTKIKQQNKAKTQQPEVNTEQRQLYLGSSISSAPHNKFEISLHFLQNIIPARMSQNWHW